MIDKSSEETIRQFILDHQADDPNTLLLSASKYEGIPMPYVVQQIKARTKAKSKIPSWWANEHIVYPPLISMEQCSSEATARLKASWVGGKTLLDLTGGAGVDTYFLGKSFDEVFYVEQNSDLCTTANHNFKALHREVTIENENAEHYLFNTQFHYDCIYIDPARRNEANKKLHLLSDCQPDVTKILSLLFEHAATVLIKTSPLLDIKAATAALENVYRVNVVAVKNEVKEVVYHLEKGHSGSFTIGTFNLVNDGDPMVFEFNFEGEKHANVKYEQPLGYLYEPNGAILKAGGFKSISERFELGKLHPNSHLYTSDNYLGNFPGRKFKVKAFTKMNKKAVKHHLNSQKANITTRNFPMSVNDVYKKLGLDQGGDQYIFATTLSDKQMVAIVCTKVL